MPAPHFPMLVAASLTALTGPSARTTVPVFDRHDVLGSIRRLQRSPTPEARAIVRQIESGPHDLSLQRAAARREGLPLTPAQLEAAVPTAALNAAPVYEQLAGVLKARPLDSSTLRVAGRLGAGRSTTPDELAAVRKMLEQWQDAIGLIHQATDRPRCAFRQDWSHGPPLLYPEFTTLRAAARLLQAESFVQAQEGRWSEAIASQARGFRVAEHAATDSFLIGYLIGLAIDRVTLEGMENILYLAGPDPEVAEAVRSTIAARRPHFDFRRALEGETVFGLACMEQLRRGGPAKLAAWLSLFVDLEVEGKARKPSVKPRKLTPAEQAVWNRLVDAAEARLIQRHRRIIASVGASYPTRAALLKQLDDHDREQPNNPVSCLSADVYSIIGSTDTQGVRRRAMEEVVMAGAALLAYRAQHPAFPDLLGEAIPVPPLDPFSGHSLKYRRERDGFVVFSVGAEGTFDGSEPGERIDSLQVYFRYPGPALGSMRGPAAP